MTVPNSRIADNPVVNIDKRPHIRRVMTLTLDKTTPLDKVEQALRTIGEVVREPELATAFDMERHPPRVALEDLTGGSAVIRVYYWFTPPDPWAYAQHAQRVNLRIAQALSAGEVSLA